MLNRTWTRLAGAPLLALAFALTLAACGDDDDGGPPPVEGIVADFQLTDVNPNSATFNTEVSPRDYRERISAWYFGAAT